MNQSSKPLVGRDVNEGSIDWAVAELDGEVRVRAHRWGPAYCSAHGAQAGGKWQDPCPRP
jgi:hypothetical protein